jgi:hypothetical protein
MAAMLLPKVARNKTMAELGASQRLVSRPFMLAKDILSKTRGCDYAGTGSGDAGRSTHSYQCDRRKALKQMREAASQVLVAEIDDLEKSVKQQGDCRSYWGVRNYHAATRISLCLDI